MLLSIIKLGKVAKMQTSFFEPFSKLVKSGTAMVFDGNSQKEGIRFFARSPLWPSASILIFRLSSTSDTFS